MSASRHIRRSLIAVAAVALFTQSATAQDQQLSVQKLIERGSLDEAIQRAEGERGNPESTYLAAHAFSKKNDNGRANEEYGRLRETGDDSWKAIGESGGLLIAGDVGGALDAANRAVGANGDNPYAHYQVGVVRSRESNFQEAAPAFGRAVQLKPDFAYAHYYAGLAYSRLKQTAKMSEHLEAFMHLAPSAPERAGVAAMLRTLRPR
jgi:tetratricopeptide (TPR) repeat protein